LAAIVALPSISTTSAMAQPANQEQIVAKIDAAVKARNEGIASYTVTEHYTVYRDGDQAHAAAEMTVKTTYKQESGKSYAIQSESGSEILRRMVLHSILENERQINLPGVREGAWFTTANYAMKVKPGGVQQMDGRNCFAVEIAPRPKSQHLMQGTLWADAVTGAIVHVEGKAKKNLSFVTGDVQVMRKYTDVDGFAQATSARAESNSFLFGRTIVTIEYLDYKIVPRTGAARP
jgi:hypothetical protein